MRARLFAFIIYSNLIDLPHLVAVARPYVPAAVLSTHSHIYAFISFRVIFAYGNVLCYLFIIYAAAVFIVSPSCPLVDQRI